MEEVAREKGWWWWCGQVCTMHINNCTSGTALLPQEHNLGLFVETRENEGR